VLGQIDCLPLLEHSESNSSRTRSSAGTVPINMVTSHCGYAEEIKPNRHDGVQMKCSQLSWILDQKKAEDNIHRNI